MQKIFCLILALILCFPLSACSQEGSGDPQPSIGETSNSKLPEKIKTEDLKEADGITVNTLEEFVAAVKPGATLIIPETGITFIPNADWGNSNQYMEWSYLDYELNFFVRNLSGLTLRGTTESLGKLISTDEYAFVLCFENCDNITLEYISAGHNVAGTCTGGVFYFDGCKDITIRNSELFGCGTEGLYLNDVNGLTMIDSVIYDCTYDLATIIDSRNITFQNTVFRDTGSYTHLFNLSESQNIRFDRCQFIGNYLQSSLEFASEQHYSFFGLDETSRDIWVMDSTFLNNQVLSLSNRYWPHFENCSFSRNLFDKGDSGQGNTYFSQPSFLSAEQQELYFSARELYLDNMNWAKTSKVRGTLDPSMTLEINGLVYNKTQGEFNTWDELYAYYTSIFTSVYADELLNVNSPYPSFIEKNGVLYTIFGDRGSHIDRTDDPDQYTPISTSNERVEFEVVGQYEDFETGTPYTEGVPIVMVNTSEGWRVETFQLTY